ncbi:MAG: hypothetical protein WDN03_00890 [Rhizomicrobium sp.]
MTISAGFCIMAPSPMASPLPRESKNRRAPLTVTNMVGAQQGACSVAVSARAGKRGVATRPTGGQIRRAGMPGRVAAAAARSYDAAEREEFACWV